LCRETQKRGSSNVNTNDNNEEGKAMRSTVAWVREEAGGSALMSAARHAASTLGGGGGGEPETVRAWRRRRPG